MAIFDDFITLKEAGSISGYHPDYIGALIRSNKVKGKKVGKNWFVSKKEVEEYFSTKHYVSVGKVFSDRAKVLFLLFVVVVLGICAVYAIGTIHSNPTPVTVQSSLSDVVSSQGIDTPAGQIQQNQLQSQ